MISGASVYPLVWNILLAARNEGFGGTITTMAVAQEPAVRELLGIPDQYAVAAVVPIGKPVKQLTKLRRQPGRGVRDPGAVRRRRRSELPTADQSTYVDSQRSSSAYAVARGLGAGQHHVVPGAVDGDVGDVPAERGGPLPDLGDLEHDVVVVRVRAHLLGPAGAGRRQHEHRAADLEAAVQLVVAEPDRAQPAERDRERVERLPLGVEHPLAVVVDVQAAARRRRRRRAGSAGSAGGRRPA